LIELGYKNIAFLCETNDEWTRGAARRRGFREAMENAGLSAHRMIRFGQPPMSIKDGYFIGSNLKHYYADIDCVFCVSDAPAFGLIRGLTECGINVPDDIGVAGFGNFEVSRYSSPTITTVKFDPEKVGSITAQLITQLLDTNVKNSDSIQKHYAIDVENCMRGSTGTNIRKLHAASV